MTDNEIINALRCCVTGRCSTGECAYHNRPDVADCIEQSTLDTLSLINRQKVEIDYWKRNAFDGCMERSRIEKTAKAEAIKEFAERLKDKVYKPGVHPGIDDEFIIEVDNLVKEMVGDDNEGERIPKPSGETGCHHTE